jgi:hypothetical protein
MNANECRRYLYECRHYRMYVKYVCVLHYARTLYCNVLLIKVSSVAAIV